jgi:hypothetical protein
LIDVVASIRKRKREFRTTSAPLASFSKSRRIVVRGLGGDTYVLTNEGIERCNPAQEEARTHECNRTSIRRYTSVTAKTSASPANSIFSAEALEPKATTLNSYFAGGAAMLETGIAVFVAFIVGFGAGYHVREQVFRKERVGRRLFLATGYTT